MKKIFLLTNILIISQLAFGQADFSVFVEPLNLSEFGGIQSFAYARQDGKILLIGGRKDGLHRRQPWASFDAAGNNTDLFVIDPTTEQVWSASLNSLTTGLREQLQATNLEFFQDGDYLYLIGGYGFAASANDHLTHNKLTAVRVDSLVQAVISGGAIAPHFRQIADDFFAVTGGQLGKLGDTYYLAGGQKFTGRYNPMNGPTFVQTYANAIKRFKILDDGTNLNFVNVGSWTDAMNLHRRDYNMLPQIFPDGSYGFTMFSGVFQQTLDLPFLDIVNFDSTGYAVQSGFSQYLNHYHSAKVAIYDSSNAVMHNLFFGGIAQFYLDSNGDLVQDDNVPFVTTIGRVSRFADSTLTEVKMGDLPVLVGAGAELVLADGIPVFDTEIVDLQRLTSDTVLLGYLLGGIKSTQPNIFFTNDGTQSEAFSGFYKVYLVPTGLTQTKPVPQPENVLLGWKIFPNPARERFSFQFELKETATVQAILSDSGGEILLETDLGALAEGTHPFTIELEDRVAGTYFLSIVVNGRLFTQSLVVQK